MDSVLYGDDILYSESTYFSGITTATWEKSFQFDFLAGTTVLVRPLLDTSTPLGTEVKLFLGEDQGEESEVIIGIEQPVLFLSEFSGPTNLYARIELISTQYGIGPTAERLQLFVAQETSLFTVARNVLTDALTPSATQSFIDPWIQNILIPFSWLNRQSHRSALSRIAEACGGVVYQDRLGVIRLESGLFTNGNTISDVINQDRILNAQSPVNRVINRVDVTTSPYVALSDQIVWEGFLEDADIGETRTFEVFFSDFDAVIEAYAVATGATIISENWFTWGGRVTIQTTATQFKVDVMGQPLVVRGARTVSAIDSASIRRNGERQISLEKNILIQDVATAQVVANAIVASAGNERRDIETDWRGDPTLEMGDAVNFDGEVSIIVSSENFFDGRLSSKIRLVKK
jgi:hypothetical protein